MIDTSQFAAGFLTGGIGGIVSGLLGVSSGGILVPLVVLFLGAEQHVAQGISLVAQVLPTSLSGVMRYRRSGHGFAWSWLVLLGIGFVAGGCAGALFAGNVSGRALQWTFVGYLVLLGVIFAVRSLKKVEQDNTAPIDAERAPVTALLGVGTVAGLSSGFLGIGGGLAITALLAAVLKLSQHRAQALSLAVTTLPLTLPAAWLYARQGVALPWWAILGVVSGLWAGTWVGALGANKLPEARLKYLFIAMLAGMAIFMATKAMS